MLRLNRPFSPYRLLHPPLGEKGQRKISQSTALVCGLGALGSVLANTLARAGVGKLRIVDRDFLELNNLQRQVLYDEEDLAAERSRMLRGLANHLEKFSFLGFIPYDNVLIEADLNGRSPYDLPSSAKDAVLQMVDKLAL